MAFTDIKALRKEMHNKEIAVFSKRYTFNGVNCYIAFCLLTDEENELDKYRFAILRLRFIKQTDFEDYIECTANSSGLDIKYGPLRRFFNIPYNPDGCGEWYDELVADIGNQIDSRIPVQDNILKNVDIDTVSRHEGRDPNRTFRSHLMRHKVDENGEGKCRTEYNAQLAALKFPHLYDIYKSDKHVSFAFTDDQTKEVDEQTAYDRFIQLENTRNNR